jgi:hypothetical protein
MNRHRNRERKEHLTDPYNAIFLIAEALNDSAGDQVFVRAELNSMTEKAWKSDSGVRLKR